MVFGFIPKAITLLKKWLLPPPAGAWQSQRALAQVAPGLGLVLGPCVILVFRTVPDT